MGLTYQSTGCGAYRESFVKGSFRRHDYVIALAGNPNTGKSTVFNALTGLNQHTGNWPGKTVIKSEGDYTDRGLSFKLVDLPGTYSLMAESPEEQVARDFLYLEKPDATVVVVDSTCLERNLNLVLQVLEINPRVVVALNLIDEAGRKNIQINVDALGEQLGVPVVATAARDGYGLDRLTAAITDLATGRIRTSPCVIRYHKRIEDAVKRLEPDIKRLVGEEFNSRWLTLRLLLRDQSVIAAVNRWLAAGGRAPAGAGSEVTA